ncbi:MerR family transcriptional regulator [Mixta calida]|uniref:MerR family transcriptional regulator n=1 Tax=Mixta calida TaxID=665913 RepID=UPI000EC68272|nr:MerR family transcriptional regulator [Mixta calida]MDU4290347.1 MerR family transcriptional regulator [Mixta calida]HCW48232.1 MerR family transcriptional regulator [Erwiniaceae bacterium]
MLLKAGELARRTGVTVRALHYYHSIGLLVPSTRSEAGYRLYNRHDIRRLHQILALKRLGVPLAEISALLNDNTLSLPQILTQQITALDRQLAQMQQLRQRLGQLHQQLSQGGEPELTDWLTTLEMMTMYDNYFSAEELKQLPFYQADPEREAEWQQMVQALLTLQDDGVAPESAQAQQLARRWMRTLERDTAHNPAFLQRLTTMHLAEPAMQQQTGITPSMLEYITRAFAESKLSIFQRYLEPHEYAFVRAHYFDRMQEWPALVAQLNDAMTRGVPPDAAEARALGAHWLALFRSYASDDPAMQAKIRQAMQQEPQLMEGTWLTPTLLGYLQAAVTASLTAG